MPWHQGKQGAADGCQTGIQWRWPGNWVNVTTTGAAGTANGATRAADITYSKISSVLHMHYEHERLVVLDADGTTINAFDAIGKTFAHHRMGLGDLVRFQKRHNIFKYMGGLKEFPVNLRGQMTKKMRKALIKTLTEIYREEGKLYAGIAGMIEKLVAASSLRVGVVSRNITLDPLITLQHVFRRNGVDPEAFDFFVHLPLKEDKTARFRSIREQYNINPARACACGDEKKDFVAATRSGMHPFMVSYGFESLERLENKIGVPPELISRSPLQLRQRLLHALDIDDDISNGTIEPDENEQLETA
jgi:phosphoglycolate phosphatase